MPHKPKISWEYILFLSVAVLNLIPVIGFRFSPTLDGPSHLYNAHLFSQLLFHDSGFLSSHFFINPEPVPNWSGHIILAFFDLFLPTFIAEKIVIVALLLGLPLVFRKLISAISPNNSLWSFTIFPFCYSFMFFLGFFNFLIGLILMFWFIHFWIRKEFQLNIRESFLAAIALLVIYFSHIFLFGFTLIVSGLLPLALFADETNSRTAVISIFLKKIVLLMCVGLPGLLMSFYFFFTRSGYDYHFLTSYELVQWLKQFRPLIAFSYDAESPYVSKIAYLTIFSVGLVAFLRVNVLIRYLSSLQRVSALVRQNLKNDIWLVIALLTLGLYFILPDSNGYSGFISVRLGFLFILFLLLWLSTQNLPKWYIGLLVVVTLICNFYLNRYYYSQVKALNNVAKEVYDLSDQLHAGDVILPLDYSQNWMEDHFSNYLGLKKPVVILENYEATMGYFPINWNDQSIPNYLMGEMQSQEICPTWRFNPNNEARQIDYVFALGDPDLFSDECAARVDLQISKYYHLIYEGTYCRLYAHR